MKNKEITIGDQVWMSRNLNVDKFRNGDRIPEVKTDEEWVKAGENEQPAWCYYDNNPANGKEYGKLYNWYAVNDPRGLAPEGWHVPSDEEWTELSEFLGKNPGFKMKSETGWDGNGNGSNESGFNGLPGGIRYSGGPSCYVGKGGTFWSSSEDDSDDAWSRHLSDFTRDLLTDSTYKIHGISVRCLRD
jgi:uncharacterized protein (TIGR02145 family)